MKASVSTESLRSISASTSDHFQRGTPKTSRALGSMPRRSLSSMVELRNRKSIGERRGVDIVGRVRANDFGFGDGHVVVSVQRAFRD